MRQMESQPCLRHLLRTYTGMVVDAKSGIKGKPRANILPEIHITCHFVFMLIYDVLARTGIFTFHIFSPCFTSISEPVKTKGSTVSFEQLYALVQRDTHHIVKRIEPPVLWQFSCTGRVTVVYPVVTLIIEEAQRSRCQPVIIGHAQ